MSQGDWITLQAYSSKYNVSLSTLRRRIKDGVIEANVSQGKYLIKDRPEPAKAKKPMVPKMKFESPLPMKEIELEPVETRYQGTTDIGVLETAHKFVEEIKTAYAKILAEKEELIAVLREEIIDLKTLVKALESQIPTKSKSSGENYSPELSEFYFEE